MVEAKWTLLGSKLCPSVLTTNALGMADNPFILLRDVCHLGCVHSGKASWREEAERQKELLWFSSWRHRGSKKESPLQ